MTLKSSNPRRLTQALRDLAWLEHRHKLTGSDIQLRESVLNALARELALKPRTSVSHAQTIIMDLVEKAMQIHVTERPDGIS